MLRSIFKYLLKKYSKSERDRLEIIDQLWKSIIVDYNEQTYPGNLRNMQTEMIMGNPYTKFASMAQDDNTLRILKRNMEIGMEDAIEYLKKENPSIDKSAFDLLMKFQSIKNG